MLCRSVEKERTFSFAIVLFYFFVSGASSQNLWNVQARNELSEKVQNPWFGFLVLCCIELRCAPSTIASQLQLLFWSQAFGDEIGHVGCYLWSKGPSGVIEEPCTKLLVVSLLSFSWIFCLFDWFEGLELFFSHLTDSVGAARGRGGRKVALHMLMFHSLGRKEAEVRCNVSKSRLNIGGPCPLHAGEDDWQTSENTLVLNHICLPYFTERQEKRVNRELKAKFSKAPQRCRGTSHISNQSFTSKGSLKIFLTVSTLSGLCVFWSHYFNQS